MQLNGALVEGNVDASNRHEAMRQVEVLGLKPIRLAESGGGAAKSERTGPLVFLGKVRTQLTVLY